MPDCSEQQNKKTTEKVFSVHILMVDDQIENLISMETVLENDFRKITKAESGSDAFKVLMQEQVDIVLLDVRMPEVNGFEVARLIRTNKKTRHIPIIFVTAATSEELEPILQFDPGTFDIVHKPVDLYALTESLEVMEEKILNKDMNSSTTQLQKTEKEIKDLLYLLTHDMNAPLRAVEQIASWIEEELPENSPQSLKDNFSLMLGRIKRMQNLLKGVVDYTATLNSEIKNETIDLNEFIHFVVSSVNLPEQLSLKVNTFDLIFEGDRVALHKILSELLSNAIKHHPSGTNMMIEVGAIKEAQGLYFYVSDNGKGIKPELRQQVFRMFQTLRPKDEFESTGAGLTLCKKLIDQRNGEIKIEDSTLGGAMVKFRIG
ncbi:MAG TPA: hybrid sensor histidine kinase/response regulator [Bacteroidia bacterium]|nr:hybrid sensor histidine kinase/response regulator [Bacteroidia bacterium]HNT79351.1 hybrid sensor histidine kinase/response regulator [Bacteroidia bacterium]